MRSRRYVIEIGGILLHPFSQIILGNSGSASCLNLFSFKSGKGFYQWCAVVDSMLLAAACGVAIPAVQCKTPATIMQVKAGGGVAIPADQCGTGAAICSSRIPLFNGIRGLSIMGSRFTALRGLLFANLDVRCGVKKAACGVHHGHRH